jgi:hypothetical protein
MRMAQILTIRLDCLSYGGSDSGQSGAPIVYRSASEISGKRHEEFTEILLDKYKPDIEFTHWPIDFHMATRPPHCSPIVRGWPAGRDFRSTTWRQSWQPRRKTFLRPQWKLETSETQRRSQRLLHARVRAMPSAHDADR